MLKDAQNKEAHAQSAQIACESTGAIRTVAALTREGGCFQEYQSSLEIPLKRAIKTGALSTFIYAFSQAAVFFVISLIFWYGSLLFSRLEITLFEMFVGIMVCRCSVSQVLNNRVLRSRPSARYRQETCFNSLPTYRLPEVLLLISSTFLIYPLLSNDIRMIPQMKKSQDPRNVSKAG